MQQLRVIVRTAVAVGNAPDQPTWNRTSEFREAGEEAEGGNVKVDERGVLPVLTVATVYLLPPPGRYPTLLERFWNFLQSTGSRSPGCSRTPGPPYGTGHTVSWPQKGTPHLK